MTLKDYPARTDTVYTYDLGGAAEYALGRLREVSYAAGSDSYGYDGRGRITGMERAIEGVSRNVSRQYDALDRLIGELYPDGEQVSYRYDGGGNLDAVEGSGPGGSASYVLEMNYTALGKLAYQVYGNGVATSYEYYDSAGEVDPSAGAELSYRLKEIQAPGVLWLSYEYDRAGNVRVKRDLEYGEEQYGYDELDRLVEAASELYGQRSYAYDEIDNIVEKDGRLYSYNPSGPESVRPKAVVSDGLYGYGYDANGNTVSRSDGRGFSYDCDNRLVEVSGVGSYAYDAEGQRVRKTEGTLTTYSFFAGYEEEYEEGEPTARVRRYYFAGSQRVAQRDGNNGLVYLHADHLGSSKRITSGNAGSEGELIRALGYLPYGEDAYGGFSGAGGAGDHRGDRGADGDLRGAHQRGAGGGGGGVCGGEPGGGAEGEPARRCSGGGRLGLEDESRGGGAGRRDGEGEAQVHGAGAGRRGAVLLRGAVLRPGAGAVPAAGHAAGGAEPVCVLREQSGAVCGSERKQHQRAGSDQGAGERAGRDVRQLRDGDNGQRGDVFGFQRRFQQ